MLKIGSIVTIKNRVGILNIHVREKLDLKNVMYGIGDDKLPEIKRPRLEFHRRHDGAILITLCNRQSELPCDIFLFFLDGDNVHAYRGEYHQDELEDETFVTIEK